jgi:MFS family permease
MSDDSITQPVSRPGYRALVLAMLLLVYSFNFLDRQILGILAGPIRADLHLSALQFGALGGIAFALLYATLGVPLAILADKTSRSWVITGSLIVWSGFTALCGLATGFGQLFWYRLGVGVGEAGGVAPSYAFITDSFPPRERARALAIYSLGVPLGLAAGALLGGYIAATVNWRMAFIILGIAGIVLAPIFRLIVREPPRGLFDKPAKAAPVSATFAILARKPSFWLLAFGASCSSLCGYGLALWLPSVLATSLHFDLITLSRFIGTLFLTGGCGGVFLGGWLADRLGQADRGAYAWLPAIAFLLTAPLFAAGISATSPALAFLFLLLPNGLNILWLGPVTTAVQHLVPSPMRATAAACFLLINNLIGIGVGPTLMGAAADLMTHRFGGGDALRYATLGALGFYLIAAVLMLLAVKPLRRDWVD